MAGDGCSAHQAGEWHICTTKGAPTFVWGLVNWFLWRNADIPELWYWPACVLASVTPYLIAISL
ncbi:hypothetical protein Aca07nite_55490 [Actinoplanes capillaceus]|uniref:Uncharacterized protein n=1 Tax=Actinoplanes campanulatus TaxID=113559 RepID=A0ABQ3WPU3_9ACTN|nr:hypothetical protein Aca07nite_55490 [Actinoplanes capillaceus]